MDSDEGRVAEVELLQAMYSGEGEFVSMPGFGFDFSLHLIAGHAPLELAVSLPLGYPSISPVLSVKCEMISRGGIEELTGGLAAVANENVGEPCVALAADWLLENASKHLLPAETVSCVVAETGEAEKRRKSLQHGSRCVMWEERGDLFDVGPEWSLCHCVSKDLEMGAGIAVQFKKRFGSVEELKSQNVEVGGVGVINKKGRYIYYLVTKNKKGGKPSMISLEASLRAMKEHISQHGVKQLAMPHIGCGLDNLSWGAVQEVVMSVFDEVDVELMVRSV